MSYNIESAIIELETLTPLFIKGKDMDYGEGFLKVDNKVYSIDNNKLCKYIYESSFDDVGSLKTKIDYTDEYEIYFSRNDGFNNSTEFERFCNKFGLRFSMQNEKGKDTKEFEEFKSMSLQFFLINTGLLKGNNEEKRKIIKEEKLAKSITFLVEGNKFIQNGNKKHFIPGSSIKGAIRNAILWHVMHEDAGKKVWLNNFVASNLRAASTASVNNQKKYKEHFSNIANASEETIDSKSFTEMIPIKIISTNASKSDRQSIEKFNERWDVANKTLRDCFRIIKISDANFITDVNLLYETAKAVCKDVNKNESYQKKFDIKLECAPAKTKAVFKISIDLNLAEYFFPLEIPFYLQSVSNLLKTVNKFFQAVATDEEMNFYNGLTSILNDIDPNNNRNAKLRINTTKVFELYRNKFNISNDNYLFRTGWGGGFLSKTQFLHLTMRDRVNIRDLVRFNGSLVAPKSRCLIVHGSNAIMPLGWCKIRILPNGCLVGIDHAKVTQAHTIGIVIGKPPDENKKAKTNTNVEIKKIANQSQKYNKKATPLIKGSKVDFRVIEWSFVTKLAKIQIAGQELEIRTTTLLRPAEEKQCIIEQIIDGKITKVNLL